MVHVVALSIWLGLMHHSLDWYVWIIRVSTSLCFKVNQLEVDVLFCLADRGHCHLYNVAQYINTVPNTLHNVKWNMQTKDMTKMALCNYSGILHLMGVYY